MLNSNKRLETFNKLTPIEKEDDVVDAPHRHREIDDATESRHGSRCSGSRRDHQCCRARAAAAQSHRQRRADDDARSRRHDDHLQPPRRAPTPFHDHRYTIVDEQEA